MASPSEQQDYFRSVSNESTTYMMVPAGAGAGAGGPGGAGRREAPSKMWVALVVAVVVVLQVASTTGLFVYLNMSISQVTENIISKQTFMVARTMPRPFNNSGSKFLSSVVQRPSAHLTLRDTSSQGYPPPGLHQSCRHVVRSWANRSLGAHLHNMTLSNGKLRVPQDGRYYLYSQVYFRYPSPASGDADQRSVSHQLVQCVYKKTSYPSPIQLLKGVGTKCWAPDAEYALHSVYQGGLFELRAGDELFVSVSSPTMLNADDSSSYFGAFRLDL
ncbi:TNF superfamily member 10, like isoform X2 [Phyllopteryx taeniolatus]|uniref:TNF superfamily member 10, like isoform X2 n=1 Tax=Phyllopteryx taeniolatus TaxID=161469 RepID=UPI002AD30B13|nr:TNF superfamily member 10, like isoform X2 [Phyllopteryx taeniolatus]